MLLKEILDTQQLSSDMDGGFVRIASDDACPAHKILCYTTKAQYERHWTDATRACRGLSVLLHEGREDLGEAEVVSRGIPKFFTMSDAQREGDDNFIVSLEDDDEDVAQLRGVTVALDSRVHVADKLDGAMCVGYVRDGLLRVHTKGSFASDEARIANRILETAYDPAEMARHILAHEVGLTPVFEVVTPQFPHIVDYGATEDLFLLGWVEIATGTWHPVTPDDGFAAAFSLQTPETLLDGSFAEMLALPARPGKEGVVVTVDVEPQRMIKVKYEEFLKMQRLRNAVRKADVTATAERLLAITGDWADADLANLDPKRLSPTDRRAIAGVDEDSPVADHILCAHILSAVPLAKDAKRDFDDIYAQTTITWGLANGYRLAGHDANDAFVKATLTHAPASLRPAIFSTKRLYLTVTDDNIAHCRQEMASLCAHAAVVAQLRRQKGMSKS